MKMGAFVSLVSALSLANAIPASAQTGGPGSLASTLTTTQTGLTNQVLNLVTTVTGPVAGRFTWTFTLTNPTGNTVQIRAFTIAPRCFLGGVTNIIDPPGWTHEVFAADPSVDPTLETNKVNWFVPITGSQSQWLQPGTTKTFQFQLGNGADPSFRGFAGALDTAGFSGDTLGCPPPAPPPNPGGGNPGPGIPVRQHGPFYLAQAYPAVVQQYGNGISPNNCFLNGSQQAPNSAATAVPGILCLAKNVNIGRINANAFATCDVGESFRAVQAVNMSKIVPGSFKCDAFGMPVVDPNTGATSPAQTMFMDSNHLRTWWTLRYTQPGTKFILDVVVVCNRIGGGVSLHIDRWVWIVVADVRTFPFLVDLLHQDAVGTLEIPCILAEDVVSTIRTIFANFSAAVGRGDRNGIFQNLVDLEAYIALNCVLLDVVVPESLFPGPLVDGQPTYQPPGNQALIDTIFGSGRPFGILDTAENPCCCKLLADLEFIGQQLGISFGPHTFLNGKPI
jgi:hypothetical protein